MESSKSSVGSREWEKIKKNGRLILHFSLLTFIDGSNTNMALNSTVYKVSLNMADMDRNYYHDHELTLARHPSETDERLMVRILAFARHAGESLSFAQGRLGAGVKKPGAKSPDAEPELWVRDLTGAVELWIEVGLPDERSIRQACGRAKQVFVYAYGGSKADRWWEGNRKILAKLKNLSVISISNETSRALAALVQRALTLHCTVQDGEMWIGEEGGENVEIKLDLLHAGKP